MDQTTRRTLYDRQEGRCVYCRRYFPVDIMHVDHKKPISKGGSDEMDNLQVLCPTCNSSKGSYTDEEYRRRAGLAPPAKAATAPSVVTFGRPSRRKFRGDVESMLWIPVRLNGVSVGYIKQTTVGADWKTGRAGSWIIDLDVLQALGLSGGILKFRSREKAEAAVEAIAERANRGNSVINRDFLAGIVGLETANKIVSHQLTIRDRNQNKIEKTDSKWGVREKIGCAVFLLLIVLLLVTFIITR